jgi:trigger factor
MPVKTEVTELADSRLRLDAEVPGDEVESSVQRAAAALGRELRIPGFRKGKVPPARVIQRVGREAVLEQAVRESLPAWNEQALIQSGARTVGDPKLELKELPDQGQPLSFSIEVSVVPEAKLGRYRELEVGRREPEVPPEAVDTEIERLREAFAQAESVERPIEPGDYAVVDFIGRVDGEPFQGGEARDYMLEVGGGRLIEGFEEQLVGARAGDRRAVEVDFPEEYEAEELQGRHAVFDVEIKDVKKKELPALDDAFASQASEFDTLAELRADIEEKLKSAQARSIEDEFRQAAVDAAVDEAGIELPEELVAARAEEMWSRTEEALRRRGIDPDAYLRASGKTREEIVEETKADAAQQLRRESLLEAVADAEGIEVSDEEFLAVLGSPGDEETAPEKLLEQLKETGRDVPIRRDLRLRKAAELIAESAAPIEMERAKAREKIWTPEKEREGAATGLWTPGDELPETGQGAGERSPRAQGTARRRRSRS